MSEPKHKPGIIGPIGPIGPGPIIGIMGPPGPPGPGGPGMGPRRRPMGPGIPGPPMIGLARLAEDKRTNTLLTIQLHLGFGPMPKSATYM